MLRLVKFLAAFIILFTGVLIIIKSLDYYAPDFNRGYLSNKKEIFEGIFRIGFYAHIISVPLILLIGTAQVFLRYEFSKSKLHSLAGKMYVFLVLILSAPGAFIISFYAFGGLLSKLSFLILTVLWAGFTYKGYHAGRKGNYSIHKNYMIRSYVLTLSAVTLRILSFIFIHYFDFHGETAYTLSAWLSWLPFLMLAEILISRASRSSQL